MAQANEMLKGDPYLHLFDLKAGITAPHRPPRQQLGCLQGQPPGHAPAPLVHARREGQVLFSADGDREPGCTWPSWRPMSVRAGRGARSALRCCSRPAWRKLHHPPAEGS
jgi:hypothetical protein